MPQVPSQRCPAPYSTRIAYNLGNFMRTLVLPDAVEQLVTDHVARKARQDRREDRPPRSLHRLPDVPRSLSLVTCSPTSSAEASIGSERRPSQHDDSDRPSCVKTDRIGVSETRPDRQYRMPPCPIHSQFRVVGHDLGGTTHRTCPFGAFRATLNWLHSPVSLGNLAWLDDRKEQRCSHRASPATASFSPYLLATRGRDQEKPGRTFPHGRFGRTGHRSTFRIGDRDAPRPPNIAHRVFRVAVDIYALAKE